MKAYLNFTSLAVPGWPSGSASNGLQVLNIIFDFRIEILTLTNLYLDIHEGIPKCYLPICTWLASIGLQLPGITFDLRIEILTLTNLCLDIHEGIPKCYLPISTWLASRISLQWPPGTRHYF
jgi:hypothetical protein